MVEHFQPTELRRHVRYDPFTGLLTRAQPSHMGPIRRAGDPFGASKDSKGYLQIKLLGRTMLAHRVAWCVVHGEWPPAEIDHINGDPADNRLSNLRLADRFVNAQNRRAAPRTSHTGVLGVSHKPGYRRFIARIVVDGRLRHLGMFDTAELAHAAYVDAKRAHHPGCTL